MCMICAYTEPPLLRTALDKKRWGYVAYDRNFGNGKNPVVTGEIHTYWMMRWRPYMMFQREVLTTISRAGPFAYRDEIREHHLLFQAFF